MSKSNGSYQIGRISKESGVPIPTIRYYEELGLLDKPTRSGGGFRLYPQEATEKLLFIRKAQELGFTLKEINRITQASRKGLDSCCGYVGSVLKTKLDELNSKIKELESMRSNLQSLLKCWIPPKEAKRAGYAVCPQIESAGRKSKGGKRNVKKKG